jgi:hypothetical protein
MPWTTNAATTHSSLVAPSGRRVSRKGDGATWLLWEVAAMVVLGIASMGLDRLRSLKKQRTDATIPAASDDPNRR